MKPESGTAPPNIERTQTLLRRRYGLLGDKDVSDILRRLIDNKQLTQVAKQLKISVETLINLPNNPSINQKTRERPTVGSRSKLKEPTEITKLPIEDITSKRNKNLIISFNPETFNAWQTSLIENTTLHKVIDDKKFCAKFMQLYNNKYGRWPTVSDLLMLTDTQLEEIMAGRDRKVERKAIHQSLIGHNIVPKKSQTICEIDLLGLSEKFRETLVKNNFKTIGSLCRLIEKKMNSTEGMDHGYIVIGNQLLRLIRELKEWGKTVPLENRPAAMEKKDDSAPLPELPKELFKRKKKISYDHKSPTRLPKLP